MVEEENKTAEYAGIKVPTQHTLAIQTPDGSLLSLEEGIAECLNQLAAIKKQVG